MSGRGCDTSDKLKGLLRRMAAAKLKEGHTNADVILQHIHEAIAEHTPLSRSEIADIIVGHGGRKSTRTELEQRKAAFYRELKDRQAGGEQGKKITALEKAIAKTEKAIADKTPAPGKVKGPEGEEVTALQAELKTKRAELAEQRKAQKEANTADTNVLKNAARQNAIEKEIAKIDARLQAGDYHKQERVSYTKTSETEKAQGRLNDIRQKLEDRRRMAERENRGKATKIADMIVELHRAAVLTSPNVLLKLPATALMNVFGARPLQEAVGRGIWRHALPGIAAKARTEGGHAGFWKTEGLAVKETLTKLGQVGEMMRTGTHELDKLYGVKTEQDHQSDLALAQMIGNIHGALKVPAVINHWTRSVQHLTALEATQMRDAGAHEDAIADHFADPATKGRIGAEAFLEAKREIFQNENAFSTAYSTFLSWLQKHGAGVKGKPGMPGKAGNAFAFGAEKTLRYMQPITKVPVNIVISGSSYVGGVAGAITHMAMAAHLGREQVRQGAADKKMWQNMVRALSPEQANSIFRNLKKNLVGAAAIAIGVKFYENFGGLYSALLKRDKDKPEDETLELSGIEFSKQLLEHPLVAAVQIGAGLARLYDRPRAKEKKGQGGIGEGVWEMSKAMVGRIPQVGLINDFTRDTSWQGVQKWAGRQVASMNPQAVQWLARNLDRDNPDPRAIALAEELEKKGGVFGKAAGLGMRMATGDKIKRKSQGFTDELLQGAPVARENVEPLPARYQ